MALTIINSPPDIAFSRNPVLFRITTDSDLDTENLRVNADITIVGEDFGTYTVAAHEEPDSNGHFVFNLSELLHSVFETLHASYNASALIQAISFHHLRYSITFREMSGNPLEEQDAITVADKYCVHGGQSDFFPFLMHQSIFWPSWLAASASDRRFLTRQPDKMIVSPETPHWLHFMLLNNTGNDGITDVKLKRKVYFHDGTDDTSYSGSASIDTEYHRIVCIRAGYNQLSLGSVNPAKTIIRYELQLCREDDSPLSATHEFLLDHNEYLNERYCLFKNSSGGWDTLRLLGQSERLPEYDEQLYQQRQEPVTNNAHTENTGYSDTTEVMKEKLFTSHRWITRRHVDWIRDLRLAPICYLSHRVAADTFLWMPAKCTSKKLDMPTSREWLYGIPLEFRHLTDNRSFSPIPAVYP